MTFNDLLTIARRNLLRNKRRTLITAFSVAFGLFLSVTFTASGDYSYTNLINTSAKMGFGHLALEPPGFNDYPTLAKRLTSTNTLEKKVLTVPGVTAAYARIVGQAMFASGAKSVGGQFIALDSSEEKPDQNLFIDSIVEGTLFPPGRDHGALIGVKMAEKLNLHLGKKMIYTVTDKDGEMVSAICRISGIFKIGEDNVDGSVVLLPIDRMREILGYNEDESSMLTIFVADQRHTDALQQNIVSAIDDPHTQVLTWKETQADLAGLIAIDRASNYLLQLLVGLLIAAGIFNTLLMSVMERNREFGMMMAVGMNPGKIVWLVLLESFWIAILGLILGAVITAPWYYYMTRVGINLASLVGNDYSAGGVLIDPVMKLRLFKESGLTILVAVFGLTMLAGIYPAVKAALVKPVESLKA